MQTSRESRIRQIFDEVGRGSSLERALDLIAEQVATDIGAPTCKIWVVKRGDICERCALAEVCANRQMCMHLIAASGAEIDREYPRIPLSVFKAPLITSGGVADFSEPSGSGEKLFSLQHSKQPDSSDSYALYPLRSASGTIGLIGVFNRRPIREDELQTIDALAPAAVAAIRVAELQSRCDSLKVRLAANTALAAQGQTTTRERELEEALAFLRVEREALASATEEAGRRLHELEAQSRQQRDQNEALVKMQEESGHQASEMAYHLEADRHRLEEENQQLRGRLVALEASLSDFSRVRLALTDEIADRTRELEGITARAARLEEETAQISKRGSTFEKSAAALEAERAALSAGVTELERSLRLAEDARSRLEQTVVQLESNIADATEDRERLTVENSRVSGENEQLVSEVERLRSELAKGQLGGDAELSRLISLNSELMQALAVADGRASLVEQENASLTKELAETRAQAEGRVAASEVQNTALRETAARLEEKIAALKARTAELEKEKISVEEANLQLEEALKQFESLSARLEDTALKLRTRAEASERARADLEQRNRVLIEENRRLVLDAQSRARFLADMSHELRTPMNAIIGFTSLLVDDRSLRLSDRHRRSLERVSRNARDLLELINNVLDLSKIEAGRMDVYAEPADARDLIDRALGVVESLKEGRPIQLISRVENGLPAMRTDRTKLQQILINLLSNAIKFTQAGEVRVVAERVGGDQIRITITDTGVGIADSDLARIFEEFRQVGGASGRGARTGTGLGLAITRRLVEMLGGRIDVTSRLGEGSSFAVTLPIEIEGHAAPADEAEAPPADPDKTALVIDGDHASLYLTKKYLTEAGYSVAATDDPARGAEIARLARPAVITVDLDSVEDAVRTVERLAGSEKRGAIIALSRHAESEQTSLDAGADIFLRKPVERAALIAVLERAGSASPGRVLVVDDDPDALDLVLAMIGDRGYEIQTATNGREALDEIARAKPDAIILDLMLPEMDGFEVVHRLSLNPDWRSIPVVLLTARDLSHEERRALDIGTARIIQKGNFSRDELLAELGTVIGATAEQSKV